MSNCVVIFGGCGYLGSNIAKIFLRRNIKVTIFDTRINKIKNPNIKLYEAFSAGLTSTSIVILILSFTWAVLGCVTPVMVTHIVVNRAKTMKNIINSCGFFKFILALFIIFLVLR